MINQEEWFYLVKLIQTGTDSECKSIANHILSLYSRHSEKSQFPCISILQFFNTLVIKSASRGRYFPPEFIKYLTTEDKIYGGFDINYKRSKTMKLLYCIYTGCIYKSSINYSLLKCYEKFNTLHIFLKRYTKRYGLSELYSIWIDVLTIDFKLAQVLFNHMKSYSTFFPEVLFFRSGSVLWTMINKLTQYQFYSTEYNRQEYINCKKCDVSIVMLPKIIFFMLKNLYNIEFSVNLIEDICINFGYKKACEFITNKNYKLFWEYLHNYGLNKPQSIYLCKSLSRYPDFFNHFLTKDSNVYTIRDNESLFYIENELINITTTIKITSLIKTHNLVEKHYNKLKHNFIKKIESKTDISYDVINYVIWNMLYLSTETMNI